MEEPKEPQRLDARPAPRQAYWQDLFDRPGRTERKLLAESIEFLKCCSEAWSLFVAPAKDVSLVKELHLAISDLLLFLGRP